MISYDTYNTTYDLTLRPWCREQCLALHSLVQLKYMLTVPSRRKNKNVPSRAVEKKKYRPFPS